MRHATRGGGSARHAVGELRDRLGNTGKPVRGALTGRQPDDARAYTRELAYAVAMDAKGSCRRSLRRSSGDARTSTSQRRARLSESRRAGSDVRAGGGAGHQARWELRRPRGARDLNRMTKRRSRRSPVRACRRRRPRQRFRTTARPIPSWRAFAEVEVDTETGSLRDRRFLAFADVGTVHPPASLGGTGASAELTQGFGRAKARSGCSTRITAHASRGVLPEQATDDPRRPPSTCSGRRSTFPTRRIPVGASGIGEPPLAAALASCARSQNALGSRCVFRRAPVNPDTILNRSSGTAAHPGLVEDLFSQERSWPSSTTSCRPSSCFSRIDCRSTEAARTPSAGTPGCWLAAWTASTG